MPAGRCKMTSAVRGIGRIGAVRAVRVRAILADPDGDEAYGIMPTLITFDPGGTTGWCVMQVHPEALSEPGYTVLDNVEHWAQGQITGAESRQIHEMAVLVAAWPGACIVSEDFQLATSVGGHDVLSPVRINGGLAYALWLQNRGMMLQNRSDRMVASDDRLKSWGFYVREGGAEHARDATRHALVWWRKCRGPSAKAREMRAASWPMFYGMDGRLLKKKNGRKKVEM